MRVVFDIDGTLSDPTHRLHYIKSAPKDWDSFFAACGEDGPIEHTVTLARELARSCTIQFWTGRPERVRTLTAEWLRGQHLRGAALRMRADGDHRPDDVVKLEYLDHWTPDLIFEDRTRVVDAFRLRGIPCVQVAPGDF